MRIRYSADADIQSIANIYCHYVRAAHACFDVVAPTITELQDRRRRVLERGLPYLVAERGQEIAGFAYVSQYGTRASFLHSVEDSIYMHPAHTGCGLGRQLLASLIQHCESRPLRQMVAVIDARNDPSIVLHSRLGFRTVGTLEGIAYKAGYPIDALIMQRALAGSIPAL